MNGTERIAAERQRQVEVEGYTLEHDAEHDGGSLVKAAIVYAWNYDEPPHTFNRLGVPSMWPWEAKSLKISENPIRNLEKAGALIAAEIDRLLDNERSE